MDLVKYYGGEPANFLDIGGSSNPEKVVNALKIITADPNVKAILFNIFGGITRTDDVANGIVTATKQNPLKVPIVIRLTGTNEEIAMKILQENGFSASSDMRSDGTLADLLYRPAGGSTIPFSETVLADRSHFVKMAGREVFKHAVRSMADATDRALDAAKLTGKDIDLLIPHQANVRIIEATAKHAGISMDKVYVNVDRYGNTSSASVPIALDEAIERGRITEGTTVMLVAFGAGFTWASMIVRF